MHRFVASSSFCSRSLPPSILAFFFSRLEARSAHNISLCCPPYIAFVARVLHPKHRPAAECEAAVAGGEQEEEEEEEEEEGEKNPASRKSKAGVDENDDAGSEADDDEIAGDEPPTISDRISAGVPGGGDGGGDGGDRPPENQRQQGGSSSSSSNSSNAKQAGLRGGSMGVASDAQLSCPLCFTTVCLECQRHAKYSNQFRAVTGINVSVNYDEFLTLDQVSGGGGRRRAGACKSRGAAAAPAAATAPAPARHSGNGVGHGTREQQAAGGGGQQGPGEEVFHPVSCGECDHPVGVYDADEVFHFFGVIASG